MRKILLVVLGVLMIGNALIKAGEPTWTNEKLFWKYFNNQFVKKQFNTYHKDIHVQLTGEYTSQDSIWLEEIIQELRPLIEKVKVGVVCSGGNLILKIDRKCDTLCQLSHGRYGGKMSCHLTDQFFNAIGGEIINVELIVNYLDITTIYDKKNLLRYYVVKALLGQIGTNSFSAFIQSYIGNNGDLAKLESRTNESEIADSSIFSYIFLPSRTYFKEADKFVIYKSYSRNLHLIYALKFPANYVNFLHKKYGNGATLALILIVICASVLYFLILLRTGIFNKIQKGWVYFIRNGMLIFQSVVIVLVLYGLYRHGFNIKKLSEFLWSSVYLPNIWAFLILNFIYLIEKILINKDVTIVPKLYAQFFISLLVLVLPFIFPHRKYDIGYNLEYACIITGYGIVISIGWVIFNYLTFKSQNAIKEKDLELSHMREMQHKAELQALHSRINPHFLYNSLNSIAGLAKADPSRTEQMALALSDFCRYAINKSNDAFSTVEEEVNIAKTYLEIEKNRFGEKLTFEIEVADDVKELKVPRFLIQPLVENAIKHGISKITETGTILLVIVKQGNELMISIYDNGPYFADEPLNGYGLQSIFDKLEILYKGKARINWQNIPRKHISVVMPMGSN